MRSQPCINKKNETALFALIAGRTEIDGLGGQVQKGTRYGVLLLLGTRPIGLWSVRGDAYIFRELASYEPVLTVHSAAEALDVTVALLTMCQHGWAERYAADAVAA